MLVAETAREMLHSGDWVAPRYGQAPRLAKPPLAYWLAAAVSWPFGDVSETTARLPSALAALLLAALVGRWASRWYGRRAGLAAAVVQLTTFYTLQFSRKAEVDMTLCLLTTAALYLVAHQPRDELRWRAQGRWTLIYLLIGLTWLAKFHYGAAMVLAPTALFYLTRRRFRLLLQFVNPAGLAILAVLVLAWPLLLAHRQPDVWSVWRSETVGRALGDIGRTPSWRVLLQTLALLLPWTPLVLAAVPRSWRRLWGRQGRAADPREQFLWIWLVACLLLVLASADKHPNYTFAALPAASLLAARHLVRWRRTLRRGRDLLSFRDAVCWTAAGAAGSAVAAAMIIGKFAFLAGPVMIAALVVAAGVTATAWLVRARRADAASYCAAAAFLACFVVVTGWIAPRYDHRASAVHFARSVRRTLPAQSPVIVYGMGWSPAVFYVGDPVRCCVGRRQLSEMLADQSSLLVITDEARMADLERMASTRILRRMRSVAGRAPPKGSPLVLARLSRSLDLLAMKSGGRR